MIQGFGVNYSGPYFRNDQKAMFDIFIDDLGVMMFRVAPLPGLNQPKDNITIFEAGL